MSQDSAVGWATTLSDAPRPVANGIIKRADFSSGELSSLRANTTVIGRNSDIAVVHDDRRDAPRSVFHAKVSAPVPEAPQVRREMAADDRLVTVAMPGSSRASMTNVVTGQPPEKSFAMPVDCLAITVNNSVPTVTKRESVSISSPTIGKHRLRVMQLLVSESAVVLVYEDNEDAAIYEPPVGGSDAPLQVDYADVSYTCAYFGITFNQPVPDQPGRKLLLVVLNRL